jgi:TetR/AcrR family transcriptional regulator, mexJK operon transcriptional repressor
MQRTQGDRAQRTRERIRAAARRLFLAQGYVATSTDAILAEAGVSSKETLYRHYESKEELFVDVLRSMSLDQPQFSATVAALPAPRDLAALREALTMMAGEILGLMTQPEYMALVRIMIAEAPRFPHLGPLFFASVPQRGLGIISGLLREAHERGIIADINVEVATRVLMGGLLTYVVPRMMFLGDAHLPSSDGAVEGVVDLVMRALAPNGPAR